MGGDLRHLSYPLDRVGPVVHLSSSHTVMKGSAPVSSRADAHAASVLEHRESELIDHALAAVAARNPADADVLRDLVVQLHETSRVLDRTRPLRRPTSL